VLRVTIELTMMPSGGELRCEACGRRQQLGMPHGLTLEECRIIGWAPEKDDEDAALRVLVLKPRETSRRWLCPLHAPGGISKLEDVAKKGLGQ
jgi:hypothetical protein